MGGLPSAHLVCTEERTKSVVLVHEPNGIRLKLSIISKLPRYPAVCLYKFEAGLGMRKGVIEIFVILNKLSGEVRMQFKY